MRTVDLVIVGVHQAALTATIEAARQGLRVMVVTRTRGAPVVRLRRALRAAGERLPRQVTVVTSAEVVCVDGVPSVEAVVVRRVRTGRLIGVNATAVLGPGRRKQDAYTLVRV